MGSSQPWLASAGTGGEGDSGLCVSRGGGGEGGDAPLQASWPPVKTVLGCRLCCFQLWQLVQDGMYGREGEGSPRQGSWSPGP